MDNDDEEPIKIDELEKNFREYYKYKDMIENWIQANIKSLNNNFYNYKKKYEDEDDDWARSDDFYEDYYNYIYILL